MAASQLPVANKLSMGTATEFECNGVPGDRAPEERHDNAQALEVVATGVSKRLFTPDRRTLLSALKGLESMYSVLEVLD